MFTKINFSKIFAILSSVFLTVAIVVALIYSQGNTITTEGIVSTGTIKLSVSPNIDFSVDLDGDTKQVNSSNTLNNISEGEYLLRITHPEYTDWEQTVQVRPGLVTDVSVQLFPKEIDFEQLSSTNINQVFFSASNRFAYYTVTDSSIGSDLGIWRQTLLDSNIPLISESANKISNLTSTIKTAALDGELVLLPSPDDNSLLIFNPTSNKYYLLQTNTYTEPSTDTEITFDYPIANISWLNNNSLLIETDNILLDFNINQNESTIISYNADSDTTPTPFTKSSSSVVFIKEGLIYQYFDGRAEEVELESISLPKNIEAVYSSKNNDTDFIITAHNNLYFFDLSSSLITNLGDLEIISIAPSTRRLIAKDTSTGELYNITIIVSLARNVIEVQKSKVSVTESELETAEWANNSNYFIYSVTSENETSLYGADAFGRNSMALLEMSSQVTGRLNSPLSFSIPSNNSGIVIVVPDNYVTSNSGTSRNNLYRIDFSVSGN